MAQSPLSQRVCPRPKKVLLVPASYYCGNFVLLLEYYPPLSKPSPKDRMQLVPDVRCTELQNIMTIPAHQAYKTLGHYKDSAGNQMQQFIEIHIKCEKQAADFLSSSPWNCQEAWISFFAILLTTSVGYLASYHFTSTTLDHVQGQARSSLIQLAQYHT